LWDYLLTKWDRTYHCIIFVIIFNKPELVRKYPGQQGDRLCQVIPFFLLFQSCGDLSYKLQVSFVLVQFSPSYYSIKNRSSLFNHGFSSSTGAGYHPSVCLSSSAWQASTTMFDFPVKRSSRWIEKGRPTRISDLKENPLLL